MKRYQVLASHEGVATIRLWVVADYKFGFNLTSDKSEAMIFTTGDLVVFIHWLETSNWPPYEIVLFNV